MRPSVASPPPDLAAQSAEGISAMACRRVPVSASYGVHTRKLPCRPGRRHFAGHQPRPRSRFVLSLGRCRCCTSVVCANDRVVRLHRGQHQKEHISEDRRLLGARI